MLSGPWVRTLRGFGSVIPATYRHFLLISVKVVLPRLLDAWSFHCVVWLPPPTNIHSAPTMCGVWSTHLHIVNLIYCSNNLNEWKVSSWPFYTGGLSWHLNSVHFIPKPSQQRGPLRENLAVTQERTGRKKEEEERGRENTAPFRPLSYIKTN